MTQLTIEELQAQLAASEKGRLEALDQVAHLRQALDNYTSGNCDDGSIAQEALGEVIHNDEFYTRLEKAEHENDSFHLLVTSLLEDLKAVGWDDYHTFMLNEIIKYRADRKIDWPSPAEQVAIYRIYLQRLEERLYSACDMLDPDVGLDKMKRYMHKYYNHVDAYVRSLRDGGFKKFKDMED